MHPLELVFLALAVAWITNLYNFMDGSDGLAGGMSMIGFATYAWAAVQDGDVGLAVLCVALSAASAGFLARNFPPARIFLGDVGSIPLGFLAASLGLLGWRNDHWPLWFPLLVFGPFVADATITLLRRAARAQAVWRPHREHYYQRLVQAGFGHAGTALIEYAAMLACAAIALLGRSQEPKLQAIAFGCGSALLAALAIWTDLHCARHARRRGASA
jgi:UDP-N-acetylmuramyl pentapeptide phosphotransferase/UDP-N-acetylglucosamine-1-phosphate transferase